MRREASHPGLVSGRFSEQRELAHKACLGWQQEKRVPAPAHQILEADKEALTSFSHVYCIGVLNTASPSQGRVLGAGSERERPVEPTFQGQGRERGASQSPGPALQGRDALTSFQ